MADSITLEKTEVTVLVEDSSAIAGLRYQPDTQKLFVQFQSGEKEYPFYNVPSEVFDNFTSADSKGKFFHAEIRDQYPPTPEQAFRQELKTTLEAAGIDTSEPVKIQAGRDVIFKGDIDSPEVNKLSASRLAILTSALDVAANGSQAEGQQGKGVVNIDVGERRVFRMAKGEVETNDLQPVRTEQQAQTKLDFAESLEALGGKLLGRSGESLTQCLEDKGLTVGFYEDFDGYRDAWNATTDWVVEQAKTDSTVTNFLQEFPDKLGSVSSHLLERQFDLEWEPQTVPEASPLTSDQSAVRSQDQFAAQPISSPLTALPIANTTPEVLPPQSFNPAVAKRELQEFDQRLNPSRTESDAGNRGESFERPA